MSHQSNNKKPRGDQIEILSSSRTMEPRTTTACTIDRDRKTTLQGPREPPPTEITVLIHERGKDGQLVRTGDYLRSSGVVYRAMHLLEEWKFVTARISCAKVTVDIIAIRNDMALLIQVISSKKPLPNAKTIVRDYAAKIESLRSMGTSAQFQKVLMAYSNLCGWKYYEVLPGGLKPAWSLPAVT
jgi:hypothetical protein